MLMATHTSLSAGRAAGIAVGAGLGLMAAIWTMMALLGFGAVFELFPFLYVGAKVAGAAYLLYIAYRKWRSAGIPARAAFPMPPLRFNASVSKPLIRHRCVNDQIHEVVV